LAAGADADRVGRVHEQGAADRHLALELLGHQAVAAGGEPPGGRLGGGAGAGGAPGAAPAARAGGAPAGGARPRPRGVSPVGPPPRPPASASTGRTRYSATAWTKVSK